MKPRSTPHPAVIELPFIAILVCEVAKRPTWNKPRGLANSMHAQPAEHMKGEAGAAFPRFSHQPYQGI
jgi:hypothetical protein